MYGVCERACVCAQGVSQALFDDVIRHFPNPCEFSNYVYVCFKSYYSQKLRKFVFQKVVCDDVPVNVGPCSLLSRKS